VAELRTVILACRTIRDELQLAIKETGVNHPVIYIESGLHSKAEVLHQIIQEKIDMLEDIDVILLVFGYCGNSLMGIKSSCSKIVIPRVDDCIALLLGSSEARREKSREMGTYFFTQGWLDYEKNILWEYERCITLYGRQRTSRVMKAMLGKYNRLMVIDTGAYPLESVSAKVQSFAKNLNMLHEIVPGSLQLFHKLLLGQWDDEFIVLEPGQEIKMNESIYQVVQN
jgi:hypothetical protein